MTEFVEEQLSSSLVKMAINTASHPLVYAKVLIQVGYEPMLPRPTITLFSRKPALALPNILEYVSYIKKVDGLSGCYRGVVPTVCANVLGTVVFNKTSKYMKEIEEESEETEKVDKCDSMIRKFMQALFSRTVAILFSHPLEVIAVRMMVQFVGREAKYSGLFSSFVEVYKENGIIGYYSGLIPRLIGTGVVLILNCICNYVISEYIPTYEVTEEYTYSSAAMGVKALAYPFTLVTRCMAVNNCGLAAGLPPYMPVYSGWRECWSHLSCTKQLHRGHSVFWRYHTGQRILKNGSPAFL